MLITVTEDHLATARAAIAKGGLPSRCCIMVQAVKAAYPDVEVTCRWVEQVEIDGGTIPLPEQARAIIRAFDRGCPINLPVTFEL